MSDKYYNSLVAYPSDEFMAEWGDVYRLMNFLIMRLEANKMTCAETLAKGNKIICETTKHKFILTMEKLQNES